MSDRPDLRLVEGGFADGLHVRCTPLGPAFDLLAAYGDAAGWYFEHQGAGVAASGGALVELEASADRKGTQSLARSALSSLRGLGGDPGVVAVGAIGFDAATGGLIEIPRTAVRRDPEAGARLVQILGEGEESLPFAPDRLVGSFPHQAFDASRLHAEPSEETYLGAVRDAVTRIRAGTLEKVVLARTVVVEAERSLDPRRLAHRLRAVEPNAYAFAVPTPRGTLVGATPELLIRRTEGQVWSTPLAGSAPRSGDPDEDRANGLALLESAKERKEHAIVVEAIAETLSPLCERLEWDPDPVLLETANVWHLATRFEGELRDPAPSALELVAELHPTPAVCGAPFDRALELIGRLEPFERGRYGGAAGWMDASGDGEWAIALRCAELDGERATLYSGAGIVAGSVAERELDETERKFRAFLDSLRWG
jgi:isochorismate synthase